MYHRLDAADYFFGGLIIALAILFVWLFSLIGRGLYVEAECLSKGYPKAAVTYNYKGYCMNMIGTVSVDVRELE